jgi:peptidoglycan/LPS O-acetylase OafA/YrhL
MKNETLSPWQSILSLTDTWTGAQLGWLAITILFVFILHKFAIRKRSKTLANWMMTVFWIIAIVGWLFAMYMVMWEKLDPNLNSLFFLGLSIILAFIASYLVFRVSRSDEQEPHLWSRIVSGVISAFIVFGIFAFVGSQQEGVAWAILMGGLLGLFVGQLYYHIKNMNVDADQKESKEDWNGPPPI